MHSIQHKVFVASKIDCISETQIKDLEVIKIQNEFWNCRKFRFRRNKHEVFDNPKKNFQFFLEVERNYISETPKTEFLEV